MARPKKENLTLEQQLEALDRELAEYKSKIDELNQKKKALKKQIEDEEKELLFDVSRKSGLPVSECIAAIEEYLQKKAEAEEQGE